MNFMFKRNRQYYLMFLYIIIYKGWIKVMAKILYCFHGFIHRGTTFTYLRYSGPPYLSPFGKYLEVIVQNQRDNLCWYSVLTAL